MTWTRLSDNFNTRPDLLTVSRTARLLHVEALVYCNQHLTDGAVPRAALLRITDAADPHGAVAELEGVGLWRALDDGGWQIHWEAEDQEPASKVRKRQSLANERQQRQRQHRSGDHSMCNPRYCRSVTRDAVRDDSRDASRDATPPRPALPNPKELGRGARCSQGSLIAGDGWCCSEHSTPASSTTAGDLPHLVVDDDSPAAEARPA